MEDERRAIGRRLAAARNLADYTIQSAARALTDGGFPISKAGVGAWETGRNLPDALWLRRLAKLYETTVDGLLRENLLSMEAMQIAAQFDSLNEVEQRRLRILWPALIRSAASDATVEERMPITKATEQEKS